MKNNKGVLKPKIQKTDWMASGETGIIYQEEIASGDWTDFLPQGELQEKRRVRSQSCVTFSALNCIEAQLKKKFNKDYNFSDRFTAKMSGTTERGNYTHKVLDSIRKDGWLLEQDYPFSDDLDWNEFYAEVPKELKEKAKRNLEEENWEIQYEWVNFNRCNPDLELLKYHLKQAPLQVLTSFSSGTCQTEHAMMLFKIDNNYLYLFDSYLPFIRRVPLSYSLPFVVKIVVVPKQEKPKYIPLITKDLWYGMRGEPEVKYLQQRLIKLGYLSKGLDTGNYLDLTREAVYRFQVENKVAPPPVLWWNRGRYCGKLTRDKLNYL